MLINGIIIIVISIFFFIFSIYITKLILKFILRRQIVLNFSKYTEILEYHMNKAYDTIHKDRILIYSLEATKIPEEQINVIIKDFINLTKKLLGPEFYREFIELYGNEDTLLFSLVEYFNTRYELDEIRKESMNNLMESEPNTETMI